MDGLGHDRIADQADTTTADPAQQFTSQVEQAVPVTQFGEELPKVRPQTLESGGHGGHGQLL